MKPIKCIDCKYIKVGGRGRTHWYYCDICGLTVDIDDDCIKVLKPKKKRR